MEPHRDGNDNFDGCYTIQTVTELDFIRDGLDLKSELTDEETKLRALVGGRPILHLDLRDKDLSERKPHPYVVLRPEEAQIAAGALMRVRDMQNQIVDQNQGILRRKTREAAEQKLDQLNTINLPHISEAQTQTPELP